jgi:hypothetical protein
MNALRKLLSPVLLLVASAAAGQHIGSATPTAVPTAPPTSTGNSVLLEAEDYVSAMGSILPVLETGASGGRGIETSGPYGNFVQYRFRVPETGGYDLTLRFASADAVEILLLIEGPDLALGCGTCTAGEWFGLSPLLAQIEEWSEMTVNLPQLDQNKTYTLTVRIKGEARIDWLNVHN